MHISCVIFIHVSDATFMHTPYVLPTHIFDATFVHIYIYSKCYIHTYIGFYIRNVPDAIFMHAQYGISMPALDGTFRHLFNVMFIHIGVDMFMHIFHDVL